VTKTIIEDIRNERDSRSSSNYYAPRPLGVVPRCASVFDGEVVLIAEMPRARYGRLGCTARERARKSQARAADLHGRDQEGCARRVRCLRGTLWYIIRESPRLPDQGSRGILGALRFFGQALETIANDEPDQWQFRGRATRDNPIEVLPVERDRTCHSLQAGRSRAEKLAATLPLQSVAKGHPRSEVH
jgi:hypothetical protein